MPSSRSLALALALALVVAPALASASWSVHGSTEPDTPWDVGDGRMWSGPDRSPTGLRAYFNVVPVASDYAALNANSEAAGSSLLSPTTTFAAYLGAWKDCNGDGYVGMAASALFEYRGELLGDTSVCSEENGFIVGGWVIEFRWIGPAATYAPARVHGLLADPGARVWGDRGFPGETRPYACDTNPLPAGTTGSTGGLLSYVDCQNKRGVAMTVNALDEDGSKGLRFEDPDSPQTSTSLLNQPLPLHPFYAPQNPEDRRTGALQSRSGDPAFEVFDCTRPRETYVRDPTAPEGQRGALYQSVPGSKGVATTDTKGGILRVAAVRDPTTWLRDLHGSYADGLANVRGGSGASYTTGTECGDPVLPVSTNDGGVPGGGLLEKPGSAPAGAIPQRATDVYFTFRSSPTFVSNSNVPDRNSVLLSPWNLGVSALRVPLNQGPGWHPGVATPPERHDTHVLDRDTLTPAGAFHYTFYARLGESLALVELPTPTVGHYAAEWCGVSSKEIVRGFDCDATRWWNATYGAPPEPFPYGTVQRPGADYHLRDVDCFDGTLVRGAPARASLAEASAKGPCA